MRTDMLSTECEKLEIIHFLNAISLQCADRVLAISSIEDRHGCGLLLDKIYSTYGLSQCEHLSGFYEKSGYFSKGMQPLANQFKGVKISEDFRDVFFNVIFIYGPSKVISPAGFNDFFREMLWITCKSAYIVFIESVDKFKNMANNSVTQLKLPAYNAYPRNVIIQGVYWHGVYADITIIKKRTVE